jgi:hypothetical protein
MGVDDMSMYLVGQGLQTSFALLCVAVGGSGRCAHAPTRARANWRRRAWAC